MSTILPHIDWRHQAACRAPGMSNIFYPPPELEKKHDKVEREKQAKAVCNMCPVINECLDHALQYEEMLGIWGGKTEAELRALHNSRNGTGL